MNIGRRWIINTMLAAMALLLLAVACLSLRWRTMHDVPIMLYYGFLISHFHYVPYRDLYDINMPGSYFLYIALGRLTGYGDVGLRIADLLLLSGLLGLTWQALKVFGRQAAGGACLLFGLVYLKDPITYTLQREFLLLLPLAGILALLFNAAELNRPGRSAVIGLLLGLDATIKPHFLLAAVPLAVYLIVGLTADTPQKWIQQPRVWRNLGAFLAGIGLPIALMLLYLWSSHALPYFLEMVRNYWPLYTSLTGDFRILTPGERPFYLIHNYLRFGQYRYVLCAAALALYLAWKRANLPPLRRRQVALLAGMMVCFSLYTMLAGAFWAYHWLPFVYCAILLSSLCLLELPAVSANESTSNESASGQAEKWSLIGAGAFLLLALIASNPPKMLHSALSPEARSPKKGRVDAMAHYLQTHAKPGDKAQIVDCTGGTLHALLIARMSLATRFCADLTFLHHISNPYIQQLRQQFLAEFNAAQPRFVLQITNEDKPWPLGPDTERQFAALDRILAAQYTAQVVQPDYIIWERRPLLPLQKPLR